ncbi:Glu-tRNA(Gln) amidotransferase subunit GatE [Candidatus Pacearchaeota archaeon]|nr:Glu-tRNA(Gln) amidotransferase subunit GatE [Candidatus Pacearchaeota archaeon]
MSEKVDYKKLKFKAGLEIHQQLDTKKLFCNCPSLLRKDEPDYIVKRKLHVVAGEAGEVDIAARHEALKNREFIYQGYDSTCLVELDEEPPHPINREALKIALQIAILLNSKIMPITQIMRKTVVDGSNTSGFQRTVMIARDGWVETEQGRVGIDAIYLEEDAARLISRTPLGVPQSTECRGKEKVIYRLDRLGIPLVEISTFPDIKSSEQAKEVALHIGNVLRSCKVKRGIGTIRQDINLSIKGGNRIEIKGFQNPKMMIKTLNNEIKRELEIVKKKKLVQSEVRNALPDATTEFLRPMPGAARMYPETDLPLLKISRDFINEAKKDLPRLRDEVEKELRGKGLSEEMIKLLFKQRKVEEFKEMLKIINSAQLIAKVLLIFPKEIATKEKLSLGEINRFVEDEIPNILKFVNEGKLLEGQIKDVFLELVKGKSLEEAVKIEKVDINEIEEKITKIIKEKPGLSVNAYMGLVMKEFRGKISGGEVMEIIRRFVE